MRVRGIKPLLLLTWLAAAVVLPGTATPAGAKDADTLGAHLASLVRDAQLGNQLGVAVMDLQSGRKIFNYHEELPLNPASNMKLVTEAAALRELGPAFRMLTGLYGQVEPDGSVPVLVLRGYGDPTLRMSDLVELAEQLADRGVQRVDQVVVDGSYFDDKILPPLYDQQPDEVSAFRAAVGAVSIEHSAYELRVLPGDEAGDPARVRLAGAGYFEVDNAVTTKASGGPDVVAIQHPDGVRMKLALRGSVPAGILGVGYMRRIAQPVAYAGWAMVDALGRAGIHAAKRVSLGKGPDGLPLITARKSEPLAEIIHQMGKNSDNYTAEMLLKVIAAEKSRPGTSANGVKVLQQTLVAAGVKKGAATIVNGSGLFIGNKIAADHLLHVLAMMYRDPGLRTEYVDSLAVGGVDGTLEHRLKNLPAPRVVRAKTGTLADAVALSGYVFGPRPDQVYAFSFLANGIAGKIGQARHLADAIATTLADDLWNKK